MISSHDIVGQPPVKSMIITILTVAGVDGKIVFDQIKPGSAVTKNAVNTPGKPALLRGDYAAAKDLIDQAKRRTTGL